MNNLKCDIDSKVESVIDKLSAIYPDPRCALNFKTPYELMVAAQLSAQCTDARVNMITEKLFKKYQTLFDFANCQLSELEDDLKQINYFKNKAFNIKEASKKLIEDFNGIMPDMIEELLTLRGIGRKTANLILSVIYKKPSIVVDTHVIRLTNRIGLVSVKNPCAIEKELCKIVPEEQWNKFSGRLILHGRKCCISRTPKCKICKIFEFCDRKSFKNSDKFN